MLSKRVVVGVGGMKCEHCAKHVQEALETIEGIPSVQVDLKKGTATFTPSKEVDFDQIKKILEQEEFEYLGVK